MKKHLTAIMLLFVMLFVIIPTSHAGHAGKDHDFSTIRTLSDPDCKTEGKFERSCSYKGCGMHDPKNPYSTPKVPHADNILLSATCTQPRWCKWHYTNGCGFSRGTPLGHYVNYSEATCTRFAKCKRQGCNYEVQGYKTCMVGADLYSGRKVPRLWCNECSRTQS